MSQLFKTKLLQMIHEHATAKRNLLYRKLVAYDGRQETVAPSHDTLHSEDIPLRAAVHYLYSQV